ncbi:hypothetical protein KSP40_PGU005250 [Platanthera guangdongensis]|uniref:RRM domain-containing protein n=1 Tax=Platanthera guangdongensis TaxID=2320717 RepID=A0ABR2MVU3_9ASPA
MPPRKKKIVKTVRKPKSSTPSIHAVAASSEEYDPNLTQLEPSIASVSNDAAVENELQPEPEPEIESEAKSSRIPETAAEESAMDAPVDSNPPSGESPESTGVQPTEPTSVEPPASSGKKTIIRVKKVLRKKIVKKLVPKGSISAKKLDAEPLQNSNLSLKECTAKDFNPSSALDVIIQQDSMKNTNDCFESSKSDDNAEIEEECGQVEEKYDNVDSGKEDDQLESAMPEEAGLSERMKRRRTEIFVGGLDRDAKEEDLRSVFGKVGEILEVRMMMDGQTGKNKGYAFLRYVEPSQAKRAVSEFTKVEEVHAPDFPPFHFTPGSPRHRFLFLLGEAHPTSMENPLISQQKPSFKPSAIACPPSDSYTPANNPQSSPVGFPSSISKISSFNTMFQNPSPST